MATRVQTQLLPEAPNLQPTISAGGRYTVQVQQAGKNKWHALADTLSQINPALANYSAAMQTRNKMLMKEGYIDYQSDQKKMEQELATFKAEQEKTKNGIRKLVNQGLLPDDANAVRMIGALKAKAETMVNRQYRGTLFSPDSITNTVDPEARLSDVRKDFFEDEAFSSPLVKEHALAHMQKVENEFRNVIVSRQQQAAIEEGKANWLRTGEDIIQQVISGQRNINDPELYEWVNHEASLFPKANKYAFDNLILENIKEGITTSVTRPDGSVGPKYTPDQAIDFLEKLRDWNLGGGAKFADGETGEAISNTIMWLDQTKGAAATKASAEKKIFYETKIGEASNELFDEYDRLNVVDDSTYKRVVADIRKKLPVDQHKDAISELGTLYDTLNRRGAAVDTDVSAATFIMFTNAIEKGEDLTKLKDQLTKVGVAKDITIEQWSQLNKVINDKLDFDNNVLKTDAYKNTLGTYETSITGFRSSGIVGTATKSWYDDRNVKLGNEDKTLGEIIEDNHPLSDSGKQMFMDKSFTKFQVMLVAELDDQYNTALKGATPEQASNYIQTNINDIAERVFRSWEDVVLTDVKKLNPQALSNLKLSN
jgi:hypothetical protein